MYTSPLDLQILGRVLNSNTTELALALGKPIPVVREFLERFTLLVKEFVDASGSRTVAVELSRESLDSEDVISCEMLFDCLERGIECVIVDFNWRLLIHPELDRADSAHLGVYGRDNSTVCLRVFGTGYQLLVNGVTIDYIDVEKPGIPEPRLGLFARSCHQYDQLILTHCRECLPEEMDSYWRNRANRILVGQITERVFHRSLWMWLRRNVTDARVRGEVQKLSPERTDIEMTGIRDGCCYIIEVKWLGTNESNNTQSVETIEQGIQQLRAYLNRDPLATKAILVCYDGRPWDEHIESNTIDDTERHQRGDYFILYVPSEAASEPGGS